MAVLVIYLREQIKFYEELIAINEKSKEDCIENDLKPGIEFFRGKIEAFQLVIKTMRQYLNILDND